MISNEVEEREKDDILFLEAGEDAPEALEAAKEPLDFLPPLVEFSVKFPRIGGWTSAGPLGSCPDPPPTAAFRATASYRCRVSCPQRANATFACCIYRKRP